MKSNDVPVVGSVCLAWPYLQVAQHVLDPRFLSRIKVFAWPYLQVAQHELAAADVVREVAQRLHHLAPRLAVGDPPAVGVELLPIANEWLAKRPLVRVIELPHLPPVHLDGGAQVAVETKASKV